MKKTILLALFLAALALSATGCRFAVVESGATRIAIPTATPAPAENP